MSAGEHSLPGLRRQRLQRLLTPDELGDAAGVAGSTVSRIERGGVASLRIIRKLTEALECKPEELIGSGVTDAVSVSLGADPGH